MNAVKISTAVLVASASLVTAQSAAFAAPATTIINQPGYGASEGKVFVGATYQNRTRNTSTRDGDALVGVGLGNAKDLAVEISYSLNSFGLNNGAGRADGKLGDGAVNVKLHKLLSDRTSVAVGVEHLVTAGVNDYQGSGAYVAATHVIDNGNNPVAITAGYHGTRGINASAAVKLGDASVIAEFDKDGAALGASYAVTEQLTISAAVRDLGNTGGARMIGGIGFTF